MLRLVGNPESGLVSVAVAKDVDFAALRTTGAGLIALRF